MTGMLLQWIKDANDCVTALESAQKTDPENFYTEESGKLECVERALAALDAFRPRLEHLNRKR